MKVSLVIPCYNEAARLVPQAFLRALQQQPNLSLCFVNDGSGDETGNVLQGIKQQASHRITVLTQGTNSGKAEAVRRGIQHCLSQQYDAIGYWDADLATPLTELPHLVAVLQSTQRPLIALGSRVNLLGRQVRRTKARHYASRIFATLVAWRLKAPIYDSQCGAKLFRTTDHLRSACSQAFATRWVFDVELLQRYQQALSERGAGNLVGTVAEVPLHSWTEVAGSKLSFWHSLQAVWQLLWLSSKASRMDSGQHPANSRHKAAWRGAGGFFVRQQRTRKALRQGRSGCR